MTATWSRRRPKECYISIVPHLFLSVALALFPQSACAPTASPSTENITITVPQGTRNHGNPRLFCTPSKWTHIAKFFLANVVAHAATVKSVPGELTLPYLWSLVSAVVFPALGIVRGLSAIHQRAALAETPLETAARARALCMVVRMPDWRPQTGDIVEALEYGDVTNKPAFVFETTKEKRVIDGEDWNWIRIDRVPTKVNSGPWKIVFLLGKLFRLFSPRREDLESSEIPALMVRSKGPAARAIGDPCFVPSSSILGTGVRKAHGTCQLPQGYALSTVSPGTQVIGLDEDQHNGKFTGNSCSLPYGTKLKLQLAETPCCYPPDALRVSYSLPGAGDQIERYGYAAFGLTVAPYVVMSIVNLASTMLTPDYPTMYLIRSKVMEEALRREGARFEGIVGTFLNETTSNKSSKNVKFEVNNDGRIFILGLDHPVGTSEYSAKVPKEVVFGPLDGTRNPGINVVTGLFSDGPYDRPFSRPWLLISESSELSLISERRLKKQLRVLTYVSIAVASIPIAINGALSNFRSGQSTSAQRVWIMTWLAFGVCYAPYSRSTYSGFFNWLQVLVFFAPSIGSFVVVGQMLMQYGTCLELS